MADEKQGGNEETSSSSQEPTRAELTELVRAIKFAKPDASMRSVHREISQDLSLKSGFEFLSDVTLHDVKRVWKKAVTSAAAQQQHRSEAESDVMKLYTVGDGNIRILAKEYSQQAAKEAAEVSLRQQKQDQLEMAKYVHVFLDVPMDRSGNLPHQALISFRENDGSPTQTGEPSVSIDERGEIIKIQVALAPGRDDHTLYPMLLYNHDRSMKTFIHHDPKDDGYDRIRQQVIKNGTGGALCSSGGLKAYFYCRVTKQKKGPNVISIDVSSLAPPQNW